MDLIHILSETAMILNNLLNTPTFAQNLHQSFDLMSIMKVLLNRYFMEDFFNIEGIVQGKDVKTFVAVVSLAENLVYLSNNIIIEELNTQNSNQ